MSNMAITEQIEHLAAMGLPHDTAQERKDSWLIYQGASAWFEYTSLNPLFEDGVPGTLTTMDVRYAAANGYKISPHYSLKEFRCACGLVRVDRNLIIALEKLRAKHYPSGLPIVSGYRCAAHNRAVGGVPSSAHLRGLAADIPAKLKPSKIKGLGFHGIGYKTRHGLVTHVDLQTGLRNDTVFIDR